MAGERGSAVAAGTAVVIMLGMSMLFHCHVADAAQYKVEWTATPSVNHKGNFKPNDLLYFDFIAGAHNAYSVDKNGYTSCQNGPASTVINAKTTFKLTERKTYYFICTFPSHCTPNKVGPTAGMKLAVKVA